MEWRAPLRWAGIAVAFAGLGGLAMLGAAGLASDHIAYQAGRRVQLQARIESEWQPTPFGYKCNAAVQAFRAPTDSSAWAAATGTLVLYADSADAQALAAGDVVQAAGTIKSVDGISNKSYATYLRTQGIYATLSATAIERLPTPNDLQAKLWALKTYLLRQLDAHLAGDDIRGVAHALLLGSRARLDPELRRQYAATGATHILAVSGMHLSLLLAFVSFWVARSGYHHHRWPWLAALALLALYAWLAGGSGSVARSASMSVLAVAALLLRRKANVLNSLAAVWLGLLVVNPLWLYDVGLQLSCLAVLGIVLLYPTFYTWLLRLGKHWAWQAVAQLVAVSLAAQVSVLPLLLYAFGQLPTYFLTTNLLAVPVGSAATLAGFLFLLLCWVPVVNGLLAYLLQALLEALNGYVYLTAALPNATLNGLQVSAEWAVMLSLLIMGAGVWLNVRRHDEATQAPLLL